MFKTLVYIDAPCPMILKTFPRPGFDDETKWALGWDEEHKKFALYVGHTPTYEPSDILEVLMLHFENSMADEPDYKNMLTPVEDFNPDDPIYKTTIDAKDTDKDDPNRFAQWIANLIANVLQTDYGTGIQERLLLSELL